MPRPREFDTVKAVRAARELFWHQGYTATSMTDLERATGLNRSSIYQAFGSKRELFDLALRSYRAEVTEPLLTELAAPDAGLPEVAGYLGALSHELRAHPELTRRGCLVVNTVGELAGTDDGAREHGRVWRDRIAFAFTNGLRGAARHGEIPESTVAERAAILTATVTGLLLSHVDPLDAAGIAEATAALVHTWPTGAGPTG